jgi:hypothetical protein
LDELVNILLNAEDAARLSGLKVRTIRHNCAAGKYPYAVKSEDIWIIPLGSMPDHAQAQYWIEHRKPAPTENLPAVQPGALSHDEYNGIWETYSRKPGSIQEEARRRVVILDEFLAMLNGGLKQITALNITRNHHADVSKATLWRWQQKTNGHPRQYWEALLAPEYRGRTKNEIPEAAWEFFVRHWLTQNQPDVSVIYRQTLQAAQAGEWGTLPSLKTFERRRNTDIPENLRILGREGETALRQKLPHQKRDYTTLKLHELWESDGRKADTLCRWPDLSVFRPFVVIWREVRTRVVLSVRIYSYATGELIIESLASAMRRSGTSPEGAVLDNGREYANKPLTGGQKTRYRFTVKENEPVGILTRIGAKVHWTTPYHGAAKPIESFWGKLAKVTDILFPKAYTGRNTVERPEDCDPKNAIPIEEFAAKLIQAIEVYHNTPHGGHGMSGKSPMELYDELSKNYTPKPCADEHLRACRPLVKRLKLRDQYNFEFKMDGFGQVTYIPGESLNLKRGWEYDVLPDNANPKAVALIYDGKKYLGEALYQAHTPFLDNIAGPETMRNRNSAMKRTKAALSSAKGQQAAIQTAPGQSLELLALPGGDAVIKQYPEPQDAATPRYVELSNGDLSDTQTGEITPTVKPSPTKKPKQTAEEIEAELEQLAVAQSAKRNAAKLKYH